MRSRCASPTSNVVFGAMVPCTSRQTKNPELPRKPTRKKVNVVVRDIKWENRPDLMKQMTELFKGRPVTVSDCNLFGTVTIEDTK